jgi:hypothetical protein
MAPSALFNGYRWSAPMSQHVHFDPSRSLAAIDQDSTIIAVIEMSQSKWLVAAVTHRGAPVLRWRLLTLDPQDGTPALSPYPAHLVIPSALLAPPVRSALPRKRVRSLTLAV